MAIRCARKLELSVKSSSSGDTYRPYAIVFAGLVAGACAAVVSQPVHYARPFAMHNRSWLFTTCPFVAQADLLLTRICGSTTNLAECVIAEGIIEQAQYILSLGFREAFSGLGPRLAMTSLMTSIQFVLYEHMRVFLGVSGSIPPQSSAVVRPS